jgi:hypothetical protein
MRQLTNYLAFTFLLIMNSAFQSNAITYTTMNSGDWNNTVNVWSTDGGITPCGCAPATTLAGDDVTINHTITMTGNVIVNGGSQFRVNVGGQLNGTDDLFTWNPGSKIDILGIININRMGVDLSAVFNLHTGAIAICSSSLAINSGTLNINGAVINCSGFMVQPAGTMNMMNAARVYGVSSNMTNRGTITMTANCCIESNGNFRNQGGTITGNGAINSGGNINNTGLWDINIKWCATGTDLGLTSPEDCTGAQGICNAITLPVDLSRFKAYAIDNEYAQVEWTTESENNSSHFTVYASIDGKNWDAVETVSAAGTSTETIDYAVTDYEAEFGTTYYKLVQYDNDSRATESDIIAVELIGNQQEITVYPNPVKNGNYLMVKGLISETGTARIMNTSGQIVFSMEINGFDSRIEIPIHSIRPGVYLLQVDQMGAIQSKRLVITE